jgi:hypothetical protein
MKPVSVNVLPHSLDFSMEVLIINKKQDKNPKLQEDLNKHSAVINKWFKVDIKWE